MTETFDLPLKVGASGSEKLGVNKVQFGDGYESRASNGLNNQTSEWNVSITGNNERLAPYFDFMARHGGVRSFYWTPPSGEKGLFKAEELKTETLGNGLFTLTTTFTRTYSAGPIETRTINIVDGGGALIDDTKSSTATAYSSQKTEQVIKQSTDNAINNLKKEDNPFTQYAKQTALAETDKKVKALEGIKAVLTINESPPDENGNIDIAVGGDATGQINAAIEALKNEEDPFSQYALQESLNKVEKIANASATQEELKKTNQKVKALEDKKIVLTINESPPDEKGNVTIPAGVSIKDTVKADDSTWSSEQIDKVIQADASTLALSLAALSTRVSLIEDTLTLEKSNARFIYPNEGTEDNPKEIVNNTRYVLDNPFPEAKYVECVALVLFDGKWGSTPFIYSSGSFGVSATHFGDKIILQTGTNFLLTTGQAQGNPFGNISNQTKLPCKVFIKKVM